ncbi:MAG: hypothetical protein FWE50_01700 [Alphaproteobacteria bacterium]|nr:hypothetical protein [Alphaproteobacteria bacterium]
MKISEHKLHGTDDLMGVIKNATLRGLPYVNPYDGAKITLEFANKSDIVPTQRFVLQDQLDIIKTLDKSFSKHGVNILSNSGFITYSVADNEVPYTFTPPIIEVIDGQPLLIDGIHRITYAGKRPFLAIFINGVPKEFYPYQIGLKGGWNEVQTFQSKLPAGFVPKQSRYSEEDRKKYFREYPFPGQIKIMREHSKIKY